MATPSLAVEAARAPAYPALRFNARERKILASVKVYVDGLAGTASVTKAQLATGITYSHRVVAAASVATTAGATQTLTVAGVVPSDIVIVTLKAVGATPRTILTGAAGTGQVIVVMSGDPSTDHTISYAVLRASV